MQAFIRAGGSHFVDFSHDHVNNTRELRSEFYCQSPAKTFHQLTVTNVRVNDVDSSRRRYKFYKKADYIDRNSSIFLRY